MKHFAILLGCLLSGFFVTAQNNIPQTVINDVAREATDKLVAKYTLNPDQAKQMYMVQARKQRNLAKLEAIKTSNQPLYRSKIQSQQKGTLASIRRILRTKEQVELYEKTQRDLRDQRTEKRKELTIKSASKEEIEAAMLDIYAE